MNPLASLTPQERAAYIYKAATLIARLLPLTKVIESDSFTSDDRARLRVLAGNGGIFALAESLRPLCSSEAHELNRARAAGLTLALINTRTGRTKTTSFPHARPKRAKRTEDK